MKKAALAVLLTSCLSSVCFGAPLLTADDFIPVMQAPEEQREALLAVKNPSEVKTENDPELENKPVTRAMSVQDAINAIVERHEEGSDIIAMPYGGYGFVATGMGSYRKDMKNLTALRIAQRNAYVQALMQAKGLMSALVSKMDIKSAEKFTNQTATIDTDEEGLRNSASNMSESIERVTSAVLKGYVTYNVFDDFDNGSVYVTIVSTPKTQGKYSRVTSDTVGAETLNAGLNAVLAEIQNGLVPLVGGRVVEVPATGEVAFVGFGSSVVRSDKDPAIRSNLLRVAQRSAGIRADSALCGIIIGDETTMKEKLDEQTKAATIDFNNIEDTDPIKSFISQEDVATAHERQNEFRNTMAFSQTIESARRGTLPPGVIRRAWLDKEGAFSYAIAVYIPSMTNAAASAGKEMQEGRILKPVDLEKGRRSNKGVNDDIKNKDNDKFYKDSGEFKRGVSGTIKNQDL